MVGRQAGVTLCPGTATRRLANWTDGRRGIAGRTLLRTAPAGYQADHDEEEDG